VPHDFILGVKVSASDYADTSTETPHLKSDEGQNRIKARCRKKEQEADALDHVRTMASWHCVDFIEVSGGDYETPGMISYPLVLLNNQLTRCLAQNSCRRILNPLVKHSSRVSHIRH
jgi:hypothetical protein